MRAVVICLLLIAASLEGTSASLSASEGRAIEITPDNVELTNAGFLEFPIDFTGLSMSEDVAQTIHIRLWFDAQGRAIQCDPIETGTANAIALCAEAPARTRLRFAPGFGQPLRRGFVILRLTITPTRTYQLEPDRPIDFSSGSAAVPMTVVVGPQPNGTAGEHCSVSSGFLPSGAQTKLADAAQADICTALLDRTAKGPPPCPALPKSASVQWTVYECRVAATPGAFTTSIRPQADEVPQFVHADLRYPPDETAAADRLRAQDGQLQVPAGSADYPPLPLRWGLSGRVQALLGVKSDGRIAICRPLLSSGAAALDNATCSFLVRRAHYRFNAAPDFAGLRYMTASIIWALPRS